MAGRAEAGRDVGAMPVDKADIVHDVDVGARVGKDAVTFTVWAPRHDFLALRLDDRATPSGWRDISMEPGPDGYFSVTVPGARAEQRYWYAL